MQDRRTTNDFSLKVKEDHGVYGRVSEALRRLFRQKTAIVGLIMVGVVLFMAVAAALISPHDPNRTNLPNRVQPPSRDHWFGTDTMGRDILSRVIFGSRISLQLGTIAVILALVIGVTAGLLAGGLGGWVDSVIMRLVDVLLAFPALLLALAIIAILGPSLTNAMIAIGISSAPRFARVVRSQVLSIIEQDFIEAARSIGASTPRILLQHVLPNALGPIIVLATLRVGTAILTGASLSFLGLGAAPPTPSWGGMVSEGRRFLLHAPWVPLIPGLAILWTVLGFNLFGDGLRDALDPKLRKSG